jgi:large repetitive protein
MGVEKASPELLLNIAAHGRSVNIALEGTDELRYLNSIPAEANVGGIGHTHILLRENPSKAAVLEEFLHGTQDRLGVIDRLGNQGAEVHVKEFMLRHSRMLGIGNEDAVILEKLLDLERR